MKALLDSLEKFAANPSALGDNIFSVFHAINKMEWPELLAAAAAIKALKDEAFRIAVEAEKKGLENGTAKKHSSLDDPTYMRLCSCLEGVVLGVGNLIAQAPVAKQRMMVEVVSNGRLITQDIRKRWLEAIPTAIA